MCTGVEIALLAAAGASAAGTVISADAQSSAMKSQAAQAAADAEAARQQGVVAAERTRKQTQRQQAAARASLAGSGVDTGAGSAVTIDTDIGYRGEQDALNEILTGTRQGSRLEAESSMLTDRAGTTQTAGFLGAGGTLLGGYAQSQQARWRGAAPVEQRPAPVETRAF